MNVPLTWRPDFLIVSWLTHLLLSFRYLRENGYPYCLITDIQFSLLKEVLRTRREQLKGVGLGNQIEYLKPTDDLPLQFLEFY